MTMKLATATGLALVLALTACGTPQEQCIRANTKELRQVDALIAETRANLSRGYAYDEQTVTDWDWEPCFPAGQSGGPGHRRLQGAISRIARP